MANFNLNKHTHDSDGNYPGIPSDLQPNQVTETCKVTTYFRDLEDHLVREIEKADGVVACVAWLTNERILSALARLKGASIVVQKEDFLRPDMSKYPNWAKKPRSFYDAIPSMGERHGLGWLVGSLSVCGDPTIESVRCVGNLNTEKDPAFPRMHNKFIVFLSAEERTVHIDTPDGVDSYEEIDWVPKKVWTGSFNFTQNGTYSLENALLIEGRDVVRAYYSEWEQIVAMSERLDWATPWMAPQWRIGT